MRMTRCYPLLRIARRNVVLNVSRDNRQCGSRGQQAQHVRLLRVGSAQEILAATYTAPVRRNYVIAIVLASAACSFGSVDWGQHDAWKHCAGAIAAWPQLPAPPCSAMHMCANEAPLSPAEGRKLLHMIRTSPQCHEP